MMAHADTRNYILLTLVLSAIVLGVTAHAATINVPADHATIQGAINAASDGDTINVAAGTYNENLTWDTKNLQLLGAGAGASIVNGGGAGSCLRMTDVPGTARVEGFTFTNGHAADGGGVYLGNSSPTITGNTINDNTASNSGGGIICHDSSPTITDNTISENTAINGGGIFCGFSSPTIMGNLVSGNTADMGGGIYCYYSPAAIMGSTLNGNTANYGGGIACLGSPPPTITNTIVAFSTKGSGIWAAVSSVPTVSYCDVYGNVGGNYGGAARAGASCIKLDPLLADKDNGDYHLKSTGGRWNGTRWVRDTVHSPCVDTGDPTSDYSAEALPNGGRVNMGFWGNTMQASKPANGAPSVTSVAITPDPAYTDDDLTATPSGWSDPEDDPEGYDWQWEKDTGGGFAVIPSATTDTLGSVNFGRDDQIRVTCTPNDGFDTGAPVTNEIAISNTAPTVASVALSPDPAGTSDDLLATPSGWDDADGDAAGYDYQWEKDTGGGFAVIPGETTDTLGGANFERGDALRVTATPNDGADTGAPVTDEITIGNTAPTVASVDIAPDPAGTGDDLLATPDGWDDADGDPEGYNWAWDKDTGAGWQAIPGETTSTLAAANFVNGDRVRVTCTPNDGTDDGPSGQDEVTIGNTAPTVASVAISPDPAYTNNDLTAVPAGWNDPDGDPEGYDYQWAWWDGGAWQDFVGATTDTLPSGHFVKGDRLRVTCTPNDGALQSNPVISETTIQNSQPVQPTVAIAPGSPTTSDSLTARVSGGADADGDTVTFAYQWYKDGLLQPDRIYRTLATQWTSPGEEWLCAVTPNDGAENGTPGEDTVTVEGNVPPTQPTVTIKPARPTDDDSLRAKVSGSTDANGDQITYAYEWYKDGTLQPDRKWATVAAQWTSPGQQWRCVVTPSDGMDSGTPSEDTVTINTPPPTPIVEITPAAPTASEGLACNVTNKDVDGDTITYAYQWYRDGELQVGVCWPRVGAWRTRADQEWTCVVTSSDGIEDGPTATDSVDIGLAVAQPTVTISPANPSGHTSFAATASGSVCADGSDPIYAYQWYRNGTLQPGLTWRTIASWRTSVGDVWRCVVTPSDGTSAGSSGEDAVTVQPNTPPTAPTVVIAPGAPTGDDSFRATAHGSTDADGDSVSYSYQWYRNGVLQPGVTWQRIGATRTREGQVWRCVVTPNDDFGDGATGEASVTIGGKGAALTVSSLAATPTAAGAELSFTLSADASVTCEVLNIAGRAVRTIVADRPLEAGVNSLAWDGRNAVGLRVPGGMYLVRMTATSTGGARWTSMGTLNLTR